jgi:alpha-amylase/alpha-mannosidase (GH57 family)
MSGDLHVAFLWHMHQPEYRDLMTGRAALPWVRLHAAGGYGHMARILGDFPDARVTVNFVPCLVDQLLDWSAGGPADDWARLTVARSWNERDRAFLRRHLFTGPIAATARRWPAYGALYDMRHEPDRWTPHDYRTLVGLFELSWIPAALLNGDARVAALATRGGPFSPAEIRHVHGVQRALARDVLPAWRRLMDRGQVALTTTPHYHPVLPLLTDPASARDAHHDLPLPAQFTAQPSDAAAQLDLAVVRHQSAFGPAPSGLWPSEGAVSQAMLALLPPSVLWLATDQAQLYHSFEESDHADERLYQPWLVNTGARDVAMFFRDRDLSDRIGFTYSHMPAEAAVDDLLAGLEHRRAALADGPHIVTLALDGENPWASFADGGDAFLRTLYGRLPATPGLVMTTFEDYLANHPPQRRLPHLATGSWIHGDLTTWIGDPAHNQAWDLVAMARADLVAAAPDPTSADIAWRSLWAAEGSDWFWWYGHRHSAAEEPVFDATFRRHLANTYLARGARPPAVIEAPIVGLSGPGGAMAPGSKPG